MDTVYDYGHKEILLVICYLLNFLSCIVFTFPFADKTKCGFKLSYELASWLASSTSLPVEIEIYVTSYGVMHHVGRDSLLGRVLDS